MNPNCRKCGQPIAPECYRFGSPATGWEHMEGECPCDDCRNRIVHTHGVDALSPDQ